MYPPSSWILLLGSKLASAGQGRNTEVMPDAAHSLAGSFREAVLPDFSRCTWEELSFSQLRSLFLLLPLSIPHFFSPKKQRWAYPSLLGIPQMP